MPLGSELEGGGEVSEDDITFAGGGGRREAAVKGGRMKTVLGVENDVDPRDSEDSNVDGSKAAGVASNGAGGGEAVKNLELKVKYIGLRLTVERTGEADNIRLGRP